MLLMFWVEVSVLLTTLLLNSCSWFISCLLRNPQLRNDTESCLSVLQEKIEIIAKRTYGAADISYSPQAEAQIDKYTRMGFDKLPICMAKTQYSFSHDATLKGKVGCLRELQQLLL